MKYGRLTTISEPERRLNSYNSKCTTWVTAKCDCGNIKEYRLSCIKTGHTKSCSCLQKEVTSNRSIKHSQRFHPLWKVWRNIKTRCYNKKNNQFKDYGGRGIYICDEWRNDFKVFYDWGIANGWGKALTIDRVKNDGNYEPSNCRFVTRKTNNRNKRSNKLTQKRAEHIRLLRSYSGRTFQNIANLYGVSKQVVIAVVANRIWV